MDHLIGVDKRGGKGYQEVPCQICGCSLFISNENESGICAKCVQLGFPKTSSEIKIQDVAKAIQVGSLKQYRRRNGLSQDAVAKFLGISRMHYSRIEGGKGVGKNIMRKIERKVARVEQVTDFEKPQIHP